MWLIHWVATVTRSYLCKPWFQCFHCLFNVLHYYQDCRSWVAPLQWESWVGVSYNGGQLRQGFLTAWKWEARREARGPLSGSGCLHLKRCGLRGDEQTPVEGEHGLLQTLCLLLQNTSFSLPFDFSSREFARWKVNNLALERKDFFSLPLPLAPEFIRNIRLLGRRPNLQQVTENLIKKYGTHFLLSATLGGKQHRVSVNQWPDHDK